MKIKHNFDKWVYQSPKIWHLKKSILDKNPKLIKNSIKLLHDFPKNIFLVENQKLYVHAEFQVRIIITSKFIKKKKYRIVGHNPKFCQKIQKMSFVNFLTPIITFVLFMQSWNFFLHIRWNFASSVSESNPVGTHAGRFLKCSI